MNIKSWWRKQREERFRLSPPAHRLLSYFVSDRRLLLLGLLCLLAANILRLMVPSIMRHTIDDLSVSVSRAKLLRHCAILLGFGLVQAALLFYQRRVIIGVARNIEYRLRNDLYAHLQKLPLQFYQKRRTGDLMARATADLASIRMFTGQGLISVGNAVFAPLFIIPVMAWINWRLTLLAFVPMPLLVITTRFFSKRIHERSKNVQEQYGVLASASQEALAGVRVTRAFVQEKAEAARFERVNLELIKRNLELIRVAVIYAPLLQLLIGLGVVTIFWYGSNLIMRGSLTIGQYVQITLYLGFIWGPMIAIGGVLSQYQRSMASMGRINTILSITPAIADTRQATSTTPLNGEIEFRNLTFTYRDAPEPTLRNINLRIAPGQTVAFVGATGSGKSTLMNLVPRLLDAPPGQIFIDGRPIRQIPLKVLREAIGYVPQETLLFSDTIAENIAYGIKNATREEIEQAALKAQLAGDIGEFASGYDTIVGERGITLSGGQRQRTAIARALIKNPRILILDDALSSVDTHTEERILGHLRQVMKGRTNLIVSHRVSTVKDADLIVVLVGGEIVEQGTHEELIRQDGLYATLNKRQMLEEEIVAS